MKATGPNTINLTRVLRTIWLNRGISRVEIAEKLNLDKSTISNIVSKLEMLKIITEMEEGEAGPQGGRKPIKLKIRKNYCAVLGIEVQPEYCNVICLNLAGEVLFSDRVEAVVDAYAFVDVFSRIIMRAEEKLERAEIPLAGIGVGLSGIINPEDGIIYKSMPLGVESEYRILTELSALTDIPVFIDNDGNCSSWGEIIFNRDEGLQDFISILVEFREHQPERAEYGGLAIGMGLVIGGKVHYGKDFAAGEFRSVFAEKGRKGQFSFGGLREFDVKNDPELFTKFTIELSKNIALIANTFALSDCFIGGDLSLYRDALAAVLRTEMDQNWTYPGASPCRIRFSSMNDQAVSYGAASMIIDKLFTVSASSAHRGNGSKPVGIGGINIFL